MEAYRNVTKGGKGFVDCERWLRHFDALGVERFAVSVVEMRRDAAGRAPVTERRVAGKAPDHRAVDWVFRWARRAASNGRDAGSAACGAAAAGRARGSARRASRVGCLGRVVQRRRRGRDSVAHACRREGATARPDAARALRRNARRARRFLRVFATAGLVSDDVTRADVAHLVEVLAAAGAAGAARLSDPRAAADA